MEGIITKSSIPHITVTRTEAINCRGKMSRKVIGQFWKTKCWLFSSIYSVGPVCLVVAHSFFFRLWDNEASMVSWPATASNWPVAFLGSKGMLSIRAPVISGEQLIWTDSFIQVSRGLSWIWERDSYTIHSLPQISHTFDEYRKFSFQIFFHPWRHFQTCI